MTRIVGASVIPKIAAGLRRALFVGAAFIGIALAAPAEAQNIVVNGGAETGDFTGWSSAGGWGVWGNPPVPGSNPAHSGNYAFYTGCVGSQCYFSQSLNLTVGSNYTVSLWVGNNYGTPNAFSVTIGSGPALISGTNTVANFNFYSTTFVATTATELLQIGGYNNPAEIAVDDICVALTASATCTASYIFVAALVPQLPPGAPINPTNVAAAIDAFTNSGGALPAGFQNLFSLTPEQLVAALNQLSGEAATGAQTGAFELMNSFLGLMVDQSLDAGNNNSVGLASRFAPERQALPADIALAYASVLKAPRALASQPWSVWGSAYGGTNHANGDSIVVGSHDVRTNTWGIAAGIDYRLSPDTKIGFALGGAGTNWGLSDGLGGGKSDAFQAGIYGLTRSGPAYLSGALAYSSYWVSTDRVGFASDQLTANFNAYGIGGRLEGGYRFVTPVVGLTPYAALQAQSFHIPSYSETDVTGGGFGLTFNAHTASDTRGELGARLDKQIALDNGAVLMLRGRAAWAHDWVTDPSLTAAFQALPGGGGFIVNGAPPARNSALLTAGAEMKLVSSWSVMAKFDGEFASGSQTYTGTGKLRYTW